MDEQHETTAQAPTCKFCWERPADPKSDESACTDCRETGGPGAAA